MSRDLKSAIGGVNEWTPEMRKVKGRLEPTGRECAEVIFVPGDQAVLSDIREPFLYIAAKTAGTDRIGQRQVQRAPKAPPSEGKTQRKQTYVKTYPKEREDCRSPPALQTAYSTIR